MKNIIRIIVALLLTTCSIVYWSGNIKIQNMQEETQFKGAGTKECPYLICTADDLALLRDMVNDGESFNNIYFEQTDNIDLSTYDNWVPIGIFGTEHYFEGIYDGNCHYIENLTIETEGTSEKDNVGLFGVLNGTVCNLGIESGTVTGSCVGSITSHGSGSIINCWNKATINGSRAGGICDNFGGKVYCCWNAGELNGTTTGDITSYSTSLVFGCAGQSGCLVNDNFSGDIIKSVIDQDDMQAYVNTQLKSALYNYDLQNIPIKKW